MELFTEKEMRSSKKRTQSLQSNMVEVQRCLGLLCCFWHWMPLLKNFGAQRSGQCQKTASPPEVMGQWQDNDP